MAVVTLRNGEVVNLTPQNVADTTQKQIQAYKDAGATDVETSGLGAAIQEAFYKLAGVGYDTTARDEAQRTAQRVIDNPLASSSAAIVGALPGGVSSVWTDTSNAVLHAGASVQTGIRGAASGVADAASAAWANTKKVLGFIPGFADETNTTLRIVVISAAVLVAAGAAAFISFQVRKVKGK